MLLGNLAYGIREGFLEEIILKLYYSLEKINSKDTCKSPTYIINLISLPETCMLLCVSSRVLKDLVLYNYLTFLQVFIV